MASLISKVAENLEFAGYGPVRITGANTLDLFFNRDIFSFKISKTGAVSMSNKSHLTKLIPYIDTQNTPPPDIEATFCIINALYGYATEAERDASFLESDVYCLGFDDDTIELKTTYGWMDDPKENQQLVLHEFIFRGEKLWHKISTMEYDDSNNDRYYVDMMDMLIEFKEHGTKPDGLDPELLGSVLDWCRKHCYESI